MFLFFLQWCLEGSLEGFWEATWLSWGLVGGSMFQIHCKKQYAIYMSKNEHVRSVSCLGPMLEPNPAHFQPFWNRKHRPNFKQTGSISGPKGVFCRFWSRFGTQSEPEDRQKTGPKMGPKMEPASGGQKRGYAGKVL